MRHLQLIPKRKEVAPAPARRLLSHAAVQRRTEHETLSPPLATPRFGHEFTRLATQPACPLGDRKSARSSCPLFAGRCPFGGTCHLCPPKLQTKLKIGAPGDRFEHEADRMADRVATRRPAALTTETAPRMQRTVQNTAQVAAPAEAHRGLQSPGHPLDSGVRANMEQYFGQDFKEVRVHDDATATAAARSVHALAYTVGRDIVFQADHYTPRSASGERLLAHELTHVVQQTGGAPLGISRFPSTCAACGPGHRQEEEEEILQRQIDEEDQVDISRAPSSQGGILQRAGDPAEIPPGFPCPTDLVPGRPAGTDILFPTGDSTITSAHTTQLTAFRDAWVTAGGTDDILVHGYASELGDQGPNWTLSCNRAEAVRTELVRLGIPTVRIDVVAHGESTDFGSAGAPNQHAVVSSTAGGIFPLALGILTPNDNFSGRAVSRFGVGEVIDLSFFSLPLRPATDFGGLEWQLASGTGTLTAVTNVGTATYTAPARADATVRLELRVATGATAGRVVSAHPITIVEPSGVNMTVVPGTAPNFGGAIPAGTWGAGFRANVFVAPRDVSFQGVVFGEGTVAGVVTGTFLAGRSGIVHPVNTFGPAHGGNATTGTPVSPPVDNIASFGGVTPRTVGGVNVCGISSFLWAIPWEFSVAGGPRTPIAGGFTANHFIVSGLTCQATISKAGAGPFCRRLDGTVC